MSCNDGTHLRPVHLNFGSSKRHVWVCILCKKQLAGEKIPGDELNALCDFVIELTTPARGKPGEKEMLTPELLAKALRAAAEVLEKTKAATAVAKNADEEEADDEDDDFAPKKKATKKAAAFDDDDESEDEEEAQAPKKKAKATPKVTVDDVNDACKAHAKENGRAEVLKILKKQFKVASVTDLKPEQYASVIEAMEV